MARISGLHIYPVKGCRGIAVEEARLTSTGLAGDRHWMVVHPDGRFVTQRECPTLALVHTTLEADALTVARSGARALTLAPGRDGPRLAVEVWGDRCLGIDEGDDAADWFSRHLDRPVRLVRFDPSRPRPSDPEYAGASPAFSEFADGFALLVVSEASLADLNARLAAPVPMNRFRPNVVIDAVEAFDEDRLLALKDDGVDLRLVKACTRCQVTTTDQDTAQVAAEPLRTLAEYRLHPGLGGVTFGQNAIVASGAGQRLRVGQVLEEIWNF